jgi:hypothetical protein
VERNRKAGQNPPRVVALIEEEEEEERGWWITCNYSIVLKEKNIEKQKEYNLRYLLAKVRTT